MTEAHKPKVHLSREHAIILLRQMMLIRRFEDRCAELYGAQKIRGFLHLYNGQEANAVGVMQTLRPEDQVVATYREHGHALARGIPATRVMAELFGKASGCSRGRGGSMHIFDATHNFYGGNAIVAAGLPLAVGLALANKMQGRNRVTCCFFGEGAAAEGEFHESLNLASLWKLPVLFVCENNRYAMGTSVERSEAIIQISTHARSYAVPEEVVDGMDVVAVEAAALRATEAIRAGEGPQFMENMTYRFRAHSMFDAELYRSKSEVEEWRKKDPIPAFASWLEATGLLSAGRRQELESSIDQEIEDAVSYAEAAPLEPVNDLARDTYTPAGTGARP
jgi:pyruvate dehydrogenase E1 component subunit alpha